MKRQSIKRTLLGMVLAVAAVCSWAAQDGKTLKVKLDLVDFGDSVVVYRIGQKEQTFTGKNGKFEFEIQVDKVCLGTLVQPRLLRGDMEDARFYNIPLVGGETVRVWDTDKTRYDIDGTGFYADYHKVDLFMEKADDEQAANAAKYREMSADPSVSKEAKDKFYNEVYKPSFDRYQQALVDYLKAHASQALERFIRSSRIDRVRLITQRELADDEAISAALETASQRKETAICAVLMESGRRMKEKSGVPQALSLELDDW